ncbi:LysR family transcriptional regulator [uncultured Ferrimonas sp.]|uniref:LysR family transcriptional regulator n=1 Tax=uncultured Ferrimonas sp. TaxID=432640 RepID=UPI002608815F|nr:LysR family transcriptional regulator [uncultured Ferrimonas sp.]
MAHNLNQLRVLAALLQQPNLTYVGQQLHLTQSAVSKVLAQLRIEFNDPLLVRDGQRYLLSAKAQQLQQQLPQRLALLEELYQPQQFDAQGCERRFVLASSDYVAEHIFPVIVEKVAQQAPLVRLEFQLWHKSQLSQMATTAVDLVSTIVDVAPENCCAIHQGQDGLVVLMDRRHPLAATPLTLADYLQAQHLLISGGGDKDSLVDQALGLQGQQRYIRAQVPFFSAATALLANSQLLLTTPMHIAEQLCEPGQLCWQPLPFALPQQQYQLFWHQRHDSDLAHQWLRQLALPCLQGHLQRKVAQGLAAKTT